MKIRLTITIKRDIEAAWTAMSDPRRRDAWQPTLISASVVSGAAGQVDSIVDLVYDENGRELRVRERIVESERPRRLVAEYDSDQARTLAVNEFTPTGDGETRWDLDCRIRFRSLLLRLLTPFTRTPIRRRIENDMQRLQTLLEH